ncbi:MAG: NUDIX domain-containing protein [bacterium]|nr:NUDIX domain-containing protein [bacterium]
MTTTDTPADQPDHPNQPDQPDQPDQANQADHPDQVAALVPAATVVLLRDGTNGLETLMMRRNSKLSFVGGMWVFPGGRVDDADYPPNNPSDVYTASLNAAVREAAEEANLTIPPEHLVPYAHWTPPLDYPKRFATWFFLAPAPPGDVTVDGGEIHEHAWWAPKETLALHAAGEIEMLAPTYITLMELAQQPDTKTALASARNRADNIPHYATHTAHAADHPVALWQQDAGYDSYDADAVGPRHRLAMKPGGWRFEQT